MLIMEIQAAIVECLLNVPFLASFGYLAADFAPENQDIDILIQPLHWFSQYKSNSDYCS
jgi:hypothetical protein